MTSNGMLTMVAHFCATKLGYTRDEMSWSLPLSFIFILMMETMFQDKGGHMINLQDREMIDSGEADRKFKEMRENRIKTLQKEIFGV